MTVAEELYCGDNIEENKNGGIWGKLGGEIPESMEPYVISAFIYICYMYMYLYSDTCLKEFLRQKGEAERVIFHQIVCSLDFQHDWD